MSPRRAIAAAFAVVCAAVASPVACGAEPASLPVIGVLHLGTFAPYQLAAFRKGLGDAGVVAGKDAALDIREAHGAHDRLSGIAADLVRRHAAVIVTGGGSATARAVKAATATIPIVFIVGIDPVAAGLVGSLAHPGGNATGVTLLARAVTLKRLEFVRELAPGATTIAVLINPANRATDRSVAQLRAAARAAGQRLLVLRAARKAEFGAAFAALARERAGVLVVDTDTFFARNRDALARLAARYAIPAIYGFSSFVDSGGLMSYGTSLADVYYQVGRYAGRILKGEKPADLPVHRASRFELVVNLGTATALGISMPRSILLRADRVIE